MDILYTNVVSEHVLHTFRGNFPLEPTSLLGLIWLIAKRNKDTGRTPKVCDQCQIPFVPNPKSKSGRDMFCSRSCKQVRQRVRTRVRKLSYDGKKPHTIASELGVEISLVHQLLKAQSTNGIDARRKKGKSK